MYEKLRSGRIPKKSESEKENVLVDVSNFSSEAIRPEKILGLMPSRLFVISLEVFLLVMFGGLLILYLSGKIVL